MKILVITQYFWPENFRINDLCIGLKERGHEVVVLTGQPNYPKGNLYEGYSLFSNRDEIWNGIKIYRCSLIPRGNGSGIQLFLNYISFAFFAALRSLTIKESFDKILVYEPSPVTVGLPAIIAKIKFKAPIFFWVQDLWPESLMAGGGINNKLVLRFFNRITKYIYRHSRYILVQSEAFKSYILEQGVLANKLIYYPNSTEEFYQVLDPDTIIQNELPIGFKIVFAGNLGEAQSLHTLLLAAEILKKDGLSVNWILLGDGRMKEIVQEKIIALGLMDCFFLKGSYPSIEMPRFFSCADALIVSLKKNRIFSLTIPSKVQSYLACGKPIIGSLDGEGARIISEAKAGFCAPAENPSALADVVKKLFNLTLDERNMLGVNARSYFESQFEREMLLTKLEKILHFKN